MLQDDSALKHFLTRNVLLIINETQEFLQLKEHDKVLNLAFYKGMSIPKMAEKFGCTEIKIRKLLHEAVDHLKKEYVPG
jgi:DNA-directed RNA polymerase specialized sigma subunit